MTIEIIGSGKVKAEGYVTVEYVNGKTIIYNHKDTSFLVLNPNQIRYLSIGKE